MHTKAPGLARMALSSALLAVPVVAACICWRRGNRGWKLSPGEQLGGNVEDLDKLRPTCDQGCVSLGKEPIRNRRNATKKRHRQEWEAGERNFQCGPAAWLLERALARLALAKLAHRRLGADSPLIEEEWVRFTLVRRVHLALARCDIAAALGPGLGQFASLLLASGYYTPPELWTMVAKNRKQNWLVDAGMVGLELRPARQKAIDSLVAHRMRYCGDSESEPCTKKRNRLQILDEPPLAPLKVASEFPGAIVLDGLPTPTRDAGLLKDTGLDPACCQGNQPVAMSTREPPLPSIGSELSTIPEGVVLVIGDTGSGKTTLLRYWAAQLAELEDKVSDAKGTRDGSDIDRIVQPNVHWDPSKAIISQFGHLSTLKHSDEATTVSRTKGTGAVPSTVAGTDPGDVDGHYARRSFAEGRHWLSAVGLSSIPCWYDRYILIEDRCMPHHILSTGQAYRATLARRLQTTAAAVADTGSRSPHVLLLDDFATVLDSLTAASVASALGRTLVRLNMQALIATPQPALAHWLQPDTLVQLSNQNESGQRTEIELKALAVTKNLHPGRAPDVCIHLKPTELLSPLPSKVANASLSRIGGTAAVRAGFYFPVSSSVCFSTEANAAFVPNYEKEQRPQGGTVLRTRVQTDAATGLCDAVFDRAFDGTVFYRAPDFPRSLVLPGARLATELETNTPAKNREAGSDTSVDRLDHTPQAQQQAAGTTVVGEHASGDGMAHRNEAVCGTQRSDATMSKAQRKKAQKKLARAQAKARSKVQAESSAKATKETCRDMRTKLDPAHRDAGTTSPETTPHKLNQVGMIVGPSGSAKSVLLRLNFGWPVDISTNGENVWDAAASVWSHFCVTSRAKIEAVEEAFESVGLLRSPSSQRCTGSSERMWLESVRYCELSQGEQYLCDIAYLLVHCQLDRDTNTATAEAKLDGLDRTTQYSKTWRGSGVLLLDEFTSCLDRHSAKRLGAGLSMYCRKHASVLPHVVVAGCHSDIITPDAFAPDWVFEADTMVLHNLDLTGSAWFPTRGNSAGDPDDCASTDNIPVKIGTFAPRARKLERASELLRVPVIKLRLRACPPAAWRDFRMHHYKTQTLSPKARTFVLTLDSLHYGIDCATDDFTDSRREALRAHSADVCGMFEGICTADCLVGFVATIPQSGNGVSDTAPPSPGASATTGATVSRDRCAGAAKSRRMDAWRAHRTVVLPAWQGLGIGSRLSDAAAALHHHEGCDYYGQTVHPRFGEYRDRSPLWRGTLWNHSTQRFKIESWKQRTTSTRVRLRTPKFVYSHYFIGPSGESDDAAGAALAARVVFED